MTGDPSYWVYTEPNMKASEPHWGMIRPFTLYTPDSCAVPLKLAFDTDPDSTFYQQALEVMNVGNNLTQEQKDIARRWVDTPKGSGTPAGRTAAPLPLAAASLIEPAAVPLPARAGGLHSAQT